MARFFHSSSRIFLGFLMFLLIVVGYAWWRTEERRPPTVPAAELVDVPTVQKPPSATMIAAGDVWLSRKVGKLIETYGAEYPFASIKQNLSQADITFLNLESPISSRGQALPGKGICFRADPAVMPGLLGTGVDLVNLANNHSVDYDSPALIDTIDILNQAGIKSVGAGANINEARRPQIIEVNGLKVGFLAYTEWADLYFSTQYQRRFQATETIPGVAPLVLKSMQDDVKQLRPQVDVLLVSLHWGIEYTELPTAEQRKIAHTLIDGGVDGIIGHHPHWFQGIEVYKGKPIAYSLGNFVADQNFSFPTREGLLLTMQLDKQGIAEMKVSPVFIPESQPMVLKDDHGRQLIDKLKNISRRLDTELAVEGEQAKLLGLRSQEAGASTKKGGAVDGKP